MTGAEFVRKVMERVGAESAADLAETMRWRRGTERTVARWLTGETRPSFGYIMEMVETAELLSKDATIRSGSSAPVDPLESLATTVDQMADRTAAALEQIQRDVTELSARIPPAAVRRPKTGRASL